MDLPNFFVVENKFCHKGIIYNFCVMVDYTLYTLLCISKL